MIIACEEIAAALLGLMVEELGFQPRFVQANQAVAASVPAHRLAAVLIDYDHPEFNKSLIETIKASGARPVLFSPFRSRGEMKDLGLKHQSQAITIPTELESLSLALTV